MVKIIDFGFSVTTDKLQKQFCGTPSYMAPEIVKKLEYDAKSTDVWAIGILTYRMLYGVPPFKANSEKELYNKIMKGSFSFPPSSENENIVVSEHVKDIIKLMLSYDSSERPSTEGLLKHPWFSPAVAIAS